MELRRRQGIDRAPASGGESGQAVTEYVLLLSIIMSGFFVFFSVLGRLNVADKLLKPITGPFASAYQYGHPKAKGYEDGGPYKHPRAEGKDSFRIFISGE